MGFDLRARNRKLKDGGYFHANIHSMSLLRCAMLQAGVEDQIIYPTLASNDGMRVTAAEAGRLRRCCSPG